MKKLIYYLASVLISYSANSQLNYVDIDWVIDQTIVMQNGEVDTLEIDIDQNGTKDMRISSWSKHSAGIETVIEVLMKDAVGFGGLKTNNGYIEACVTSTSSLTQIVGYIYTSDTPNPHSNQYVKMPFKFQGNNNNSYCGFLYVRYVGTTITIEGYAWNPTSGGNCNCATSGWLTLEQLEDHQFDLGEFKYYNLIGQKIDNPSGLVLKVYENGFSEKIYIQN